MKKLLIVMVFLWGAFGCKKSETSNQSDKKENVPIVDLFPKDLSQSLYQLKDPFVTQKEDTISLQALQGQPVLMTMIYTSCAGACPRLISDMQNIEKALGENKNKIHFLVVSFDTEKDTPLILQQYAKRHHLNDNWILLHGSKASVRTLSVLLNISFAKDKSGIFTHDNKIALLDDQGILRYREEGLGNHPENMVQAIDQLMEN